MASAVHGKIGGIFIGGFAPSESDGNVISGICVSTAVATTWTVSNMSAYENVRITTVMESDKTIIADTTYSYTPNGRIRLNTAPSSKPILATFAYYSDIGSGISIGFHNWDLDITCDTHDVTEFGVTSPYPRSFIPGLTTWTLTAERYWRTSDYGASMGYSDAVLVKAYWDRPNNMRYEGWGILTGVSPTTPVDALVTETISIQGEDLLEVKSDG